MKSTNAKPDPTGDTSPPEFSPAHTPAPRMWQPSSEVDFTLDDLLMPPETEPMPRHGHRPGGALDESIEELLDPFPDAPLPAAGSDIFADADAADDADFLADFVPPPPHSSNIFDDRKAASPSDVLGGLESRPEIDFNARPMTTPDTDSQSGDGWDQSSQESNQIFEELAGPFPDAGGSTENWDAGDDRDILGADFGDEGVKPGSTLFTAGEAIRRPHVSDNARTTDDISFDLPGTPDDSFDTFPDSEPVPSEVPAEVVRSGVVWGSLPLNSAHSVPGFDLSPPTEYAAVKPARWAGPAVPLGSAAAGAALTAGLFLLLGPSSPEPVVEPVPVASVAAVPPPVPETPPRDFDRELALEREKILKESEAGVERERRSAEEARQSAETARAERVQAEAALAKLKADAELAKSNQESQFYQLKEQLALAATQLKAKESRAESAQAQLDRAQAQLKQAEAAATTLAGRLAQLESAQARERQLLAERQRADRQRSPAPAPSAIVPWTDAQLERALAQGIDLYRAGRAAEAESVLTQATARGGDARSWYYLGFARLRLGQSPDSAFRQGVALERQGQPPTRDVQAMLEGVDQASRQWLRRVR